VFGSRGIEYLFGIVGVMEFSIDRVIGILATIAIPAGIGVGIAMDTKTVGELRFAQTCFISSSVIAVVFVTIWGITTNVSVILRVVTVMVLFAIVGLGLVESIKWAQQRHDDAEHATSSQADSTWHVFPPTGKKKDVPDGARKPKVGTTSSQPGNMPVKLPVPEIAAKFIQAMSPGVILVNTSQFGAVVRDPSCSVSMWNLSKNPPVSLPTFNQNNPGQYIKTGSGLLLATVDNPLMKPLVSAGDKVFGFVSVDCPDCKNRRFYWLYVVYGHPTEAWYLESPEGQQVDLFSVSSALEKVDWDIDAFMLTVPHGARITPEKPPRH